MNRVMTTKERLALLAVLALSFPLIQLGSPGNTKAENASKDKQIIGTIDLDWLAAHLPDDHSDTSKRLLRQRLQELFKTAPFTFPVFYKDAVIAGNTLDVSEKTLAMLKARPTAASHAPSQSRSLFISYDAEALYDGLCEKLTQRQKIAQLSSKLDSLRAADRKKLAEAKARGLSMEALKALEADCGNAETKLLVMESDLIQSTTTDIRAKVEKHLPELVGNTQYVLATDITPMPIRSLNKDLTKMLNAPITSKTASASSKSALRNPMRIDTIDTAKLGAHPRYYGLNERVRITKLKELASATLASRGDTLALEINNCPLGGTDITDSIIAKLEPEPQTKPDYAAAFLRQCSREITEPTTSNTNTTNMSEWTVYAPALPVFYLGGASSGFIPPGRTDGSKPSEEEQQEYYYRGECIELSSFIQDAERTFGKNTAVAALFINARGLRALKHNRFWQAKLDFSSALYLDNLSTESDSEVIKNLKSMGPFFEHRKLYAGRGRGGVQAFESEFQKDYWVRPGAPVLNSHLYSKEMRIAGYFHNYKLVADRSKTKHSDVEKSVEKIMRNYKEDNAPILTKI
ncbi:MAG: hypothetical protein JNN26_26480 [Candidatus Obscuribacter sp.]|nr:hypothetical protein [Candidatus Obscuribacter sp.]